MNPNLPRVEYIPCPGRLRHLSTLRSISPALTNMMFSECETMAREMQLEMHKQFAMSQLDMMMAHEQIYQHEKAPRAKSQDGEHKVLQFPRTSVPTCPLP